MKNNINNKAVTPDTASVENKSQDFSTRIEGRDADSSKGEAEYNFPLEGITVVATSLEEATSKMKTIKSEREAQADASEENK